MQKLRRKSIKSLLNKKGSASNFALAGALLVGVAIAAYFDEKSPVKEVIAQVDPQRAEALAPSETIQNCAITDGDTIRCGEERIRLIGIDAPEMKKCREGRKCVDGDPVASKNHLNAALAPTMQIVRYGQDHYGRTLARVASNVGDLSCWQIKNGHAVYKKQWDKKGVIASLCPQETAQL